MKGFLLFLGLIVLLIGSYIFYHIKHPSDTMIVRQGAYWTILDYNASK